MSQYGVYRLPDGMLVLDLQSDLVETGTRVVAPLLPLSDAVPLIRRLEPEFEIEGRVVALRTAELAAVPERLLAGPEVADLSAEAWRVQGALDLVFSGV